MKNRIKTTLRSCVLVSAAVMLVEHSAQANLLLRLDSLESEKVAQVESGKSPASETSTPSVAPSKPASSAESKSSAVVPVAPPPGQPPSPPAWTVQLRATIGGSRIAGESQFKADRIGAGMFAGKRISGLAVSLPFLDTDSLIVGASYQTATGVDPISDRSWSIQNLGAQARLNVSPLPDSYFDFALQAGLGLQRLVSEEPQRRTQKALYSAGLTLGGYARTLLIDGIHGLAGADFMIGRASSLGLALGIESNL